MRKQEFMRLIQQMLQFLLSGLAALWIFINTESCKMSFINLSSGSSLLEEHIVENAALDSQRQ